jgi:hypothetical protein
MSQSVNPAGISAPLVPPSAIRRRGPGIPGTSDLRTSSPWRGEHRRSQRDAAEGKRKLRAASGDLIVERAAAALSRLELHAQRLPRDSIKALLPLLTLFTGPTCALAVGPRDSGSFIRDSSVADRGAISVSSSSGPRSLASVSLLSRFCLASVSLLSRFLLELSPGDGKTLG